MDLLWKSFSFNLQKESVPGLNNDSLVCGPRPLEENYDTYY